MKNVWKPVSWLLIGLAVAALVAVLLAGLGTWFMLQDLPDAPMVLTIDDESLDFDQLGAWGSALAALSVVAALLIVAVVVPGSLLIGLLATVAGLAVAAGTLLSVAALLLSPLLLPLGLGLWWWRRAHPPQRGVERSLPDRPLPDRSLPDNTPGGATPT